jgi:adenylate cyclase
MQFRIGINLGDVIHDSARVYGDGVNVAARLESIAEPGGICVSAVVRDQVHKKLTLALSDLGTHSVKNIPEPVRVYRVDPPHLLDTTPQSKPQLALPNKPSVAVLPFTNLSGDTKEDYLCDGLTEDIITELSRFSELFVIARNSSFQYKGRSPDVRQVGRELGVRYVLEGSIRRGGDRLRITAQLIDASNGAHRWAERYDRKLEDIFDLQDEVTRTIVAILAAHVSKAEAERTLLKPPADWQAYDYFMRASDTYAKFWASYRAEDLYETRRLLEKSISIDPQYARAYVWLSNTYRSQWVHALDDGYLKPATLQRSHELAKRAVELDPYLPEAHAQLGYVLAFMRQHDLAMAAYQRAHSLNRNFIDWREAVVLIYAGEPRKAIDVLTAHMRIDPFYPATTPSWLGFAYYLLGQYAEALPPLRECISRAPNFRNGHVRLAATFAQLGQLEQAQEAAKTVLRLDPSFTIDGTGKHIYVFRRREDEEHFFDGLRKAGLPAA